MNIGRALEGGALLLNSLFSPIWVDGRHDNNPGLIDQLSTKQRKMNTDEALLGPVAAQTETNAQCENSTKPLVYSNE